MTECCRTRPARQSRTRSDDKRPTSAVAARLADVVNYLPRAHALALEVQCWVMSGGARERRAAHRARATLLA